MKIDKYKILTINNPLFIGGSMKSGTTLLRTMLSYHPNIFGGMETHWFTKEFLENWDNEDSIILKKLCDFYNVTNVEINQIIEISGHSVEFINNFLGYCTLKSGKKRWVEKTPGNLGKIDEIYNNWRDAKFINCIRDCRDIYASWKKINKLNINLFIDYFLDLISLKGDTINEKTDNYYFIKYEDLIKDRHNELVNLFNFISEEYQKDIGDFKGDNTVYNKVLNVVGKVSTTGVSLSKPLNDSGVGQYHEVLSRTEVRIIEKELSDYLTRFNYLK